MKVHTHLYNRGNVFNEIFNGCLSGGVADSSMILAFDLLADTGHLEGALDPLVHPEGALDALRVTRRVLWSPSGSAGGCFGAPLPYFKSLRLGAADQVWG